ncbi:MAG: long-chain fatty acid--CoA ligase [Bacteroidales bacterium]|jgi:long-chain acyl-CoA synthetase|nr:long-chain fatty acid--CoA ligase [Bacteroidales bacterium]
MAKVTRIFDILDHCAERFSENNEILGGKEGKVWVTYSTTEYIDYANNVSNGLLAMGLKKGDKVAIISNSMPEWNFFDMGTMQAGIINVPIYPTISESEHIYILNHSDVEYVFISGYDMLRRIETILPQCPNIKKVITLKPIEGYESIYDIMELGKNNKDYFNLNSIKTDISCDDIATIIYTSGTTGTPKGVMLSHKNIVSNFLGVVHIPAFKPYRRAISYLPLCHVYERMIIYMYQYLGLSLFYAENIPRIADNFKEVKPYIMCSVPRLIEKTFDKIINTGKQLTGIKHKLFFWAVALAERFELNGANGFFYEFKRAIADKLIYSKWRQAVGGNMGIIVSGGAAISEKLVRIFTCAKINIFPGYGLTETSPVISVTTFRDEERGFNAVGGIMAQNQVKIADDGEILTKGPSLMVGYYKAPELTAEVIDKDGWFHTGDLGRLEKDGKLLIITGRKKSLFKNSFGKYINPDYVENYIKESQLIDNAMVVGENQKYCAALIVPDFMNLQSWCKSQNLHFNSVEEMVTSKQVIEKYRKDLLELNKGLSSTEKISNFVLLPTEWTVDSGELSAALKVKRHFVANKYKDEISNLFT